MTEEAYDLLASLKGENESFTDVIRRLAGERSLLEIVAVIDDAQAAKLEARLLAGRERARKRRQKQLRRSS